MMRVLLSAVYTALARRRLQQSVRRTIQAAFDELDPFDQKVFYGHRITGLNYRELAEMHGVSVEDIMQAMIRSLATISFALDEKHPDRWQLLDPNLQ